MPQPLLCCCAGSAIHSSTARQSEGGWGPTQSHLKQYLHREHTPRLVPERCAGVLRVEGLQDGVGLIGEGRGVQCRKVKDQVVKDKFHTDPGVLGQAWEGRRAARDELGGVHVARLLKLGQREGRRGGTAESTREVGTASTGARPPRPSRAELGDGEPGAGGRRPWGSYMKATTGHAGGARCLWDHSAPPLKPLAQP